MRRVNALLLTTTFLLGAFVAWGQDQDSGGPSRAEYEEALAAESDTTLAAYLAGWGQFLYRSKPDSATLLFEQALDFTEKSLKKDQTEKEKNRLELIQIILINNLAYMYERRGLIPKAMTMYQQCLRVHQETGNRSGEANALNNIGFIHYRLEEDKEAIKHYDRSIQIRQEIRDSSGLADTYNNMGLIYRRQDEPGEALKFYTESLKIREALNDTNGITNSLGNMAFAYEAMGEHGKALELQNRSLALRTARDDLEGMAGSYRTLGNIYFALGDFRNAYENAVSSYDIAVKLGYPGLKYRAALLLYEIYDTLGKSDGALEYYRIAIENRDSIQNDRNRRASLEQSVAYEFEKEQLAEQKEREKEEAVKEEARKKEKALDEAQDRRREIVLYLVSVGLLLVAALAIILFNRFRITKRQKTVIEDQKLLVEEKNADIVNSLNYASRIQKAVLTSDEYLSQIMPAHFVFYRPRDIVSGDFYWAYETGDLIIWTAADCTGHGVPGAFMSMIGSALLNEIVVEKGITEPGQILDDLRTGVINALEQKGLTPGIRGNSKQRDGMDMALCVWDRKQGTLRFAGANNPVWVLRENGDGVELLEMKANKQPIGAHEDQVPFETKEMPLQPGDSIYVFSDGLVDQFGGEKGKKYKARQFMELLKKINGQPLNQQKEAIVADFDNWKGDLEQVDDVCVIGVRV